MVVPILKLKKIVLYKKIFINFFFQIKTFLYKIFFSNKKIILEFNGNL